MTQNARGYVKKIGLVRCLVPANSLSASSGTIAAKAQARAAHSLKQKPVLSVASAETARVVTRWRSCVGVYIFGRGGLCEFVCVPDSCFLPRSKCSLPSGCGVRNTSTTSSCPLPSTAPGPRGTRTSTTARGKQYTHRLFRHAVLTRLIVGFEDL